MTYDLAISQFMLQTAIITKEDILYQIKLSGKIHQTIEAILKRKVVENAVAEVGIQAEKEELQKAADKFRFINRIGSADDTWTWLEQNNLSLDDFEKIVRTKLLANKLAEHLFCDRVESYLLQHQLDYTSAAIYEVILDDKELAVALFFAIEKGKISFQDIARQYSQDQELQRKAGYQGRVNLKDLKPELSAIVFAAKPPQLLKPIVTSLGVHLILVEEIIQAQLDEKLQQKIIADLFSQWLKEQIAKVEVVKHLDFNS
jgi:parvulin-like peptidyl-prolyl isomerase